MNNKEFDIWLRSKTNELEIKASEGDLIDHVKPDWNRMSRMLEMQLSNDIFDSKLKNSLKQAKVISYEANWEHFQQRMQLMSDRRHKIIKTRTIELALVLLIFWTLNSLIDQDVFSIKNKVQAHPNLTQTSNVIASSSPEEETRMVTFNGSNEAKSSTEINEFNESPYNDAPLVKSNINKNGSSRPMVLNNSIAKSTPNFNQHTTSKSLLNSATSTSITPVLLTPEQKIISNSSILPDQNSADQNNASPIIGSETMNSKIIPVNGSNELKNEKDKKFEPKAPSDQMLNSNNDSTLNKAIPKNNEPDQLNSENSNRIIPINNIGVLPIKRFIWYGIGVSIGVIGIHSSKFAPLYYNEYTNYINFISKNIRLALNYPNWMLEFGADFSKIDYNPGNYLKFSQFKEGDLIDIIKHMEFQIIDLPMNLHYKIFQMNKLQFTTYAGLSLSICKSANYSVTSAISKVNENTIFFDPNANLNFIEVLYNKGIRHDRSLNNNTFTNANLGIKFTYQILDYLKLSADLNYKNSVGKIGFGPLDEKYKNFNLGLGMYYSVK
ncbi:MAG: hypothetical protein ABIO44_02100 [Saprospiraceae bacterium]